MPEKPDRGRKMLELSADVATVAALAADVGATGGALVGGKLLWDAIAAGINWRRRRQAQAYLDGLAKALGEDNAVSLATQLDEAGENPVWETVEEGFRVMMAAIDETAKRCIALLVADYVVRQELPDREFQQLGELIVACDSTLLRFLLQITSRFVQLREDLLYNHEPPESPDSYMLLASQGSTDGTGIIVHRSCAEISKGIGMPPSQSLGVAVRLLERCEFGAVSPPKILPAWAFGSGEYPSGGVPVFWFSSNAHCRIQRLHNYLNPIFLEIPARD